MLKLTFLGTSHGFAEKNRFTSGTLIETENYSYVLDAGAPLEYRLVNLEKSFDSIRGIFITHMHNDHVDSLSSLIVSFLGYRRNEQSVCFLPEQNGIDAFLTWLSAMHCEEDWVRSTVDFRLTKPGVIFDNGDVRVTAVPNLHLFHLLNNPDADKIAFSYIFEKDGRSVLFTGDMGGGFKEYPEIIGNRHFNLVVCEMAHGKLSEVQDLLKKTDTDRMLITHYHMPMIEGYEKIFPEFPFDVQLAVDGMTILV